MTTDVTNGFRQRPSRWATVAIRVGMLVVLILFGPLALLFARRSRDATGKDVLDKRARELWQTSPLDAIALVRTTFDQLVAAGGWGLKAVTIDGLGKFEFADIVWVHRFLYDCEVAAGRYEEALAVAAALPGRLEINILRQVDCLVALGRKPEAIALLERNLDIDSWRAVLRNRLRELSPRSNRRVV